VAIRGQGLGDNYCACPDFAVNTLGTCKHIEFVLNRLRRKRGARKAFIEGFRPVYSEVYLRYGARRAIVFKPGTECSPAVRRLAAGYFDADGVLRPEAYVHFESFLSKATGRKHDLRCYDDALNFIAQVRDQTFLAERIDKLFPRGVAGKAFGRLLKIPLYRYQREGVLFAAKAGRSLIADDMGLGKTVQAIGACELLGRAAGVERVLVVCPTSLKHQWKREIETFCGRSAVVIEGSSSARNALYAADSFYKIVNYDVVHRDGGTIRNWDPDVIVLDEAQRIKNWNTRRAKTVKKLDSKYAIVLTGTPLENRLEELHAIVEFVDRFRLGPMFRFLAEHQQVDDNGRVIGYRNLDRIGQTLEPVLIRRTKKQVLKELPERLDKNYFVPMTREQMLHHEENREIVGKVAAKWRRLGFLPESDQRRLMIALQKMRMSCNSTYLLDRETDHGVKADETISVLQETFERPNDKAVVFSQWLGTHEILLKRLRSAKLGYVLFHGRVPSKNRKGLIQQFREDPDCRVFLSTDAGGVGLNLQNAAAVVNMDLPWNPAVLDQRIGRVHRLGQHRPVRVINFVSQGTIEQGMLSVLSFKKSMFAGVLDGGSPEVFLGGTRFKRFMDSVDQVTGSIPPPMPTQEQAAAPTRGAAEREESPQVQMPVQADWGSLVAAGVSFLNKLGSALSSEAEAPVQIGRHLRIETDEATGQRHLKVPVPPREVLSDIAGLLNQLAEKL
jgi:SNF2 family DNA or RNA helicase